MFAALDGVDALDRAARRLSRRARATRSPPRRSTLAQALAEKVRDEKLSGQVLAARSGALRRLDRRRGLANDGDDVVATVGSFGDVKYAAIQEYGGRTGGARNPAGQGARRSRSSSAARCASRARVEHPGSTIPERSYLRSSLDEASDEIVAALAATPDEAWEPRMSREAAFSALFAAVSAAYPWGLASRRHEAVERGARARCALRCSSSKVRPGDLSMDVAGGAAAHARGQAVPLFRRARSRDAGRQRDQRRARRARRGAGAVRRRSRARPPDARRRRPRLQDHRRPGARHRRPRRRRAGGGELQAGGAVSEGATMRSEDLRQRCDDLLAAHPIAAEMAFANGHLTLGAGTRLAKLSAPLDEPRLTALLTSAYGGPIEASRLRHIRRAVETWRDGDRALALTHLALQSTGKARPSIGGCAATIARRRADERGRHAGGHRHGADGRGPNRRCRGKV